MLPMLGAVEAWLVIYNNLPFSIRSFANVVLFFFLFFGILNRLLKL